MVTNGKLSNEDYSLSCIVCGSQEHVALVPHRAADKVRGIFCFCEKCWPEYAGATLRTEWIKDVGEVAPKDAAEALITSTNKQSPKSGRSHMRCIYSLNGKRGYHKKCSTCYPRYHNFKAA
jgi:hypothetical protein